MQISQILSSKSVWNQKYICIYKIYQLEPNLFQVFSIPVL